MIIYCAGCSGAGLADVCLVRAEWGRADALGRGGCTGLPAAALPGRAAQGRCPNAARNGHIDSLPAHLCRHGVLCRRATAASREVGIHLKGCMLHSESQKALEKMRKPVDTAISRLVGSDTVFSPSVHILSKVCPG